LGFPFNTVYRTALKAIQSHNPQTSSSGGRENPEPENNFSLSPDTGIQNEWRFTSTDLTLPQDITLRLKKKHYMFIIIIYLSQILHLHSGDCDVM
jgi:hypothetical protein